MHRLVAVKKPIFGCRGGGGSFCSVVVMLLSTTLPAWRVGAWFTILAALVVPTALVIIRTGFCVEAGEEAVEILCILELFTYERGCIGVVHNILVEVHVAPYECFLY
jgi:hypothetical protein